VMLTWFGALVICRLRSQRVLGGGE